VLPKPDFCATHPTDPTCVVFGGSAGSSPGSDGKQVAQAVQSTVQLINQGQGSSTASGAGQTEADNKKPEQAGKASGPAQAENTGAKNEKPATKMYCN
jgi:hypothetical protein